MKSGAADFLTPDRLAELPLAVAEAFGRSRRQLAVRRSKEELVRLAFTDGLTGLRNRRFFDQSLPRELALSRRLAVPLSLLVVDLDRFKAINDSGGHSEGDRVLIELSGKVRGIVRSSDLAARYGGDELALLLPNTARDGAMLLATRLVRAAGEISVPSEKRGLSLSCGIGTVSHFSATCTGGDLFETADRALYRAKAAGGRSIVTAELVA